MARSWAILWHPSRTGRSATGGTGPKYLALRTFAPHEALEEVQRPNGGRIPVFLDRSIASGGALDLEGLTWHFRVKPGVAELAFDDLHYAAEAINSYEIFRSLRAGGVIPSHVRFQVGFPASSAIKSTSPIRATGR